MLTPETHIKNIRIDYYLNSDTDIVNISTDTNITISIGTSLIAIAIHCVVVKLVVTALYHL